MKYRRLVAAGLAAAALTAIAAGCGDSGSTENSPTTAHDMCNMAPGETMPEHDMSKMKPGDTMPVPCED